MRSVSYRGRQLKNSNNIIEDESHRYVPISSTAEEGIIPMKIPAIIKAKFSWRIVLATLAVWIMVVNYYERTVVGRAMALCNWSKWEQWADDADPHRVAIFADPQIMDAYSYPDRPAAVNYIARRIIDNYHRRNWNFVQAKLNPDSTIFLGDLFDGGRNWDDDQWFDEYKRFNSIYEKKPNRKTIFSLPGNHDIGFGDTVNSTSLERFKAFFGPTSSLHHLGNHSIILLDTISLSDNANMKVREDAQEFLQWISRYDSFEEPRILMTHVPMYRDPKLQQCGPLRESKKNFPIMKGVQYQTVIDYSLSQEILTLLKPKIAFSGDDHDYCHVTHTYSHNNKEYKADEITVKSCSMNMGIKYPAIQLLSLYNPDKDKADDTFKTNICYLPQPYKAFKTYIATAIINTIVYLMIFLLPNVWNSIVARITEPLTTHNQVLPIAEHKSTVHNQQSYIHKDYLGFVVNSTTIIIGVLVIFSIYYNAFI